MSLAYLGDFLIVAAATCAVGSLVAYALAWRGKIEFVAFGRRFFTAATGAMVLAIACLMYLIITHDFSVAYVYSYSSTDLPLGYLIASLWGGQEGTFLLWGVYTVIFGIVMMRTAGKFERGNMVFLNLFLLSLLLIMLKKSPFELLPVLRAEGAGLNPLLQNFWMQIHPPIMFLGFAGATFPFLFAMTGLVERKYREWSEAARRWTMFAWATLGVSLVMGGYWAYETLGWGGFWAWDPVENSSLIPWIFLTAQVHALFIKRQRKGLMRFSFFVVCLSFWSVLYGTFLTRSGVLADFSVHSFVDLGINAFLISGLYAFLAIGLSLLFWRWGDIKPQPSFSKVRSRSYLVTLGVVFLFLGGALVLLGTSSPLLTSFAENPSAVGLPYYYATMTPIAIGLLLLIGLFPAFKWNNGIAKPKLLMIGLSANVSTMIVLAASGITWDVMYLLLFGAAGGAAVVNGYAYFLSLKFGRRQSGYLSHVGLSIALIGAAASAGFETKQIVILPQNEAISVMGLNLTFVESVDNPKGFDCHVEVNDGSSTFMAILPHEFPSNAEGVMKKPHVESYLWHDLYLAPISLERPESEDPGTLFLQKEGSTTLDKYNITFHDYNMAEHGSDGSDISATALVTITYGDVIEDVRPALKVIGNEITPVMASFDSGRGSVYIAGVRPEDGGIILKVVGDFLPAPKHASSSLVVELSKKPLIILFWLGTLIVFLGGGLSMMNRKRLPGAELPEQVVMSNQQREIPVTS